MILFLYGADTFRSRQHRKKIMEKFKANRDPQGYNVVCLDAMVSERAQRIMEELLAPPFLAEKRMVIIESLLAAKQPEVQEALLGRLAEGALPASTVAVFWEGADEAKGKTATALFEFLAKEKYTQRFDLLSGARLATWFADEVAAAGGRIAPDALPALMRNAPEDPWQRSAIVEQLAAYRRGEEIKKDDIALFLEQREDESIFSLVDAVIAGRLSDAYAMMQGAYRRGEEPQYVFAMLLRQFRIFLELRDLLDREEGAGSDALAKKLSLHPFVVKKSLPFARKLSYAELKKRHAELLALDRSIKTGGDAEALLDIFAARLA